MTSKPHPPSVPDQVSKLQAAGCRLQEELAAGPTPSLPTDLGKQPLFLLFVIAHFPVAARVPVHSSSLVLPLKRPVTSVQTGVELDLCRSLSPLLQ